MDDASIMGNSVLEVTDVEMFALLGQKDCEIFMKDKALERLQGQFDRMRGLIVELEGARKRVVELEVANKELIDSNTQIAPLTDNTTKLEASNKSLSDMNIKLDTALTEERKKCATVQSEYNILSVQYKELVDELGVIRVELTRKDEEIGELKNGEHVKGKKRSTRRPTNT